MSSCVRNGKAEFAKLEPGLSLLSAHLLHPKSRKMPAADCGHTFTSSNGDGLADSIRRCRLNSKSLANLLCSIARSALRRTGQDREALRRAWTRTWVQQRRLPSTPHKLRQWET